MVNIIVPMYHSKDTIGDTLRSFMAQTNHRFWVTLVQDADGEDYSDIIDTFDPFLNITLLQMPENGGPGNTRQLGIDKTPDNFDYVMFVDSDDMLNPRAVEMLQQEARRTNADIVMSQFIREERHGPGGMMAISENSGPTTWTHGKIYRLAYLREHNIRFMPQIRFNEDGTFNNMAFAWTTKTYTIPEITYIWRDNPNSLTSVRDEHFDQKVADTYFEGLLYYFQIMKDHWDELPRSKDIYTAHVVNGLINAYKYYYSNIEMAREVYKKHPVVDITFITQKLVDYCQNNIINISQCYKQDNEPTTFYQHPFYEWVLNVFTEDQ